jgi:hypothetical protein
VGLVDAQLEVSDNITKDEETYRLDLGKFIFKLLLES